MDRSFVASHEWVVQLQISKDVNMSLAKLELNSISQMNTHITQTLAIPEKMAMLGLCGLTFAIGFFYRTLLLRVMWKNGAFTFFDLMTGKYDFKKTCTSSISPKLYQSGASCKDHLNPTN